MKKIGTGLFILLIVGQIIGWMSNSDDSSTSERNKEQTLEVSEGNKKQTSEVSGVEKYSNLPLKKDLSFFITPKNIVGQFIVRTTNSSLSNYEKGFEFSSGRNLREEKLQNAFFINRNIINLGVATAAIDSKEFNEFEIDDFEEKLREEMSKVILPIREAYKNVDKHIRLNNLNIPVKYSKESPKVASVSINRLKEMNGSQISMELELLKKINSYKPILLTDFIKEALNNQYISQYIMPSKETFVFGAIVNYDDSRYSTGLKIEGDAKLLNEIGKANKGSDIITELTLHAWEEDIHPSDKQFVVKFAITSFKLKGSDKRFVSNNYVNLINSMHSFGDTYYIEDNDVKMYMKNDD